MCAWKSGEFFSLPRDIKVRELFNRYTSDAHPDFDYSNNWLGKIRAPTAATLL